jgi:hypothetical protein
MGLLELEQKESSNKSESQVQTGITDISNALETLQDIVVSLSGRLSGVVIPVDSLETAKENVVKLVSMCAVASILNDKAIEIWGINKKLSDILSRLAL